MSAKFGDGVLYSPRQLESLQDEISALKAALHLARKELIEVQKELGETKSLVRSLFSRI